MNNITYLVSYIILLNIVTSYRLYISTDYELFQKTIQIIIIWVIPFLGAILISFFLNQIPIVLTKKYKKFSLLLRILFFPFMIKIEKRKGNFYYDGSNENYGSSHTDVGGGGGD